MLMGLTSLHFMNQFGWAGMNRIVHKDGGSVTKTNGLTCQCKKVSRMDMGIYRDIYQLRDSMNCFTFQLLGIQLFVHYKITRLSTLWKLH